MEMYDLIQLNKNANFPSASSFEQNTHSVQFSYSPNILSVEKDYESFPASFINSETEGNRLLLQIEKKHVA